MPKPFSAPTILDSHGNPVASKDKSFNLDPQFWLRGRSSQEISAEIREQPYAKHPFVYACCSAITMNLARLPKYLQQKNNLEAKVDEHSFLSLLNRPNELMSGTKIWEITFLSLLLPTARTSGGQCFWIGVGKDGENFDFMSRKDLPFMLFPFNDSMFKPVLGESNTDQLFGWRMELPGGKGITFKTNEILRFNFSNPYDLYKGLSPLSAAMFSLHQDAKAAELNASFFDNNASLGGTLTTEQKMSTESARDMAVQWRQEYSGASKAGKIAVLHSGLEYQQIQGSHADMQFIEQKKLNREDIMAVYRVPKSEVSLYEDLNYATAISADKSFWQKTLKPHDDMVLSVINESWLRFYDAGKWKLKSDYSGIESLNADYKDRIEQMKNLVAMQIPVAEAARLLSLPIDTKNYPWLETVFVASGLVTAEAISDEPIAVTAPPSATTPTPKIISENKKLFPPISLEEKIGNIFQKDLDDRKKKIEDYFIRAIDPIEKNYRKSLSKFFIRQRNLILDKVDEYFKNKKAFVKASDINIDPKIFYENLRSEDAVLRGISEEYYDKEIKAQAKEMESELGELGNWDIDSESTQKFKNARLTQLKKINSTTFNQAGKQIRKVIADAPPDITPQELSRAIKKAVEQVYTIRNAQARTIARTEIGVIAGGVRNDIMTEEGIKQTQWVSVLDEVTRDSHLGVDGEIVDIGEDFSNGLAYPLDPSGDAEEIINCRCVSLPVK